MRLWALRNRIRDLLGLAPVPPPGGAPVPPVPRITVALAGAVPGVLVRLVPAVLVVLLGLLAGFGGGLWVVAAMAAVGVVVWPTGPAAAAYIVLVAGVVLAGDDLLAADPVRGTVAGVWRTSALMVAVHVFLVATALAGNVAWRALVERAVLLRAAGGVLTTQAVAQTLLLLVAFVRASQPGQAEWLRLVALAAVAAVAVLVLPRAWLTRRPRRRER